MYPLTLWIGIILQGMYIARYFLNLLLILDDDNICSGWDLGFHTYYIKILIVFAQGIQPTCAGHRSKSCSGRAVVLSLCSICQQFLPLPSALQGELSLRFSPIKIQCVPHIRNIFGLEVSLVL